MSEAEAHRRAGLLAGFTAYGIWGLLPIYVKALHGVGVFELLAHRALWSLLLMALLILVLRKAAAFAEVMRTPAMWLWLGLSSFLVACNWLIYAWAVMHNAVLETSLGYFINPLISVALGVVVLRERLRLLQWVAVGCAAAGVAVQTFLGGVLPYLALSLALSFALYGLVRKKMAVDPVVGLGVETLWMAPLALAYLALAAPPMTDHGIAISALLVLSGPITGITLICFTFAARRLPLSTLGLMQYTAPSLVFVQGVFLYYEQVGLGRALAFLLIWAGLALFAIDGLRLSRAERRR